MKVVIISLSSGREEEYVWENRKEKEVCDGWGMSVRLLFTCFQYSEATRDPFPLILLSLSLTHTHKGLTSSASHVDIIGKPCIPTL